MVVVWDGVDPDQLAAHFGSMLENPVGEHESCLRDQVIPKARGMDTAQPPPPAARKVIEIHHLARRPRASSPRHRRR